MLKSVPNAFGAYFKNSGKAIEAAKPERNFFAAFIFILLFFVSEFIFTLSFLSRVDSDVAESHTRLDLTSNVEIFHPMAALILGIIAAAAFALTYILVRFFCVKIFTRKVKIRTVLADSFIEFGLNAIPLSLICLLGAALCCVSGFFFIPVILFFCLFHFIILQRGIFEAVPKEKNTLLFHMVTALFSMIGFVLITAAISVLLLYILLKMIVGIADRVKELIDMLYDYFDSMASKYMHFLPRR